MFDQTTEEGTKAKKYDAVLELLTEASGTEGDAATLYVNFASAAGAVPVDFPLSVANYINPLLLDYFRAHRTGRFGIVPMDFQTSELNTLIVQTNPTK
jgi:1-phosphatidylinositol phosphodiesterase